MKIKANSYRLYGVSVPSEKDNLIASLRHASMMYSVIDEEYGAGDIKKHQFLMPGGKVVLQVRGHIDLLYLDVIRTSLFEPKYVRKIVKKLGGEFAGSSDKTLSPDKTLEALLN